VKESAADRQARRKAAAEQRQKMAPLKKEVERCEKELERLAKEKAEVEEALGDTGLYDAERKDELKQLLDRQAELARRESEAEAAWVEASESLESLEADAYS
jgi:ATP-binding cassette subfamily F protein 3